MFKKVLKWGALALLAYYAIQNGWIQKGIDAITKMIKPKN